MGGPAAKKEAVMWWLGEQCRSLRGGEGIREFCRRAGIDAQRYAAIEEGSAEATLEDVCLIAAAHGITPSCLLDGI